jgi:hypothetical protein
LRGRSCRAHRWDDRRKLRRRSEGGDRLRETIEAVVATRQALGFGEGLAATNDRMTAR